MAKSVRFDFADLKLFSLIAEYGSISAAADAMPIALSAASARVKVLEQRLGLPLLVRKPRGVALNHAGKLFLEHAQKILRAAEEAQRGMDALSGKGRSRITLYTNTTGLSTHLPRQLSAYLHQNPGLDIAVEQHSSREIIEAVTNGKADLGIADGDYNRQSLLFLLYQRNQLVVLTDSRNALAKNSRCRFEQVLEQPMVGYEKESSLQLFIERMSRFVHKPGNFRVTAPNFQTVASLVAAGLGNAILPRPVAESFAQNQPVKTVDLDEPWANRELYVCLRQDNDVNLQAHRLARFLAQVE